MSDSLNVALRISAVDAFGGVLNSLRRRIGGVGDEARRVQGEYDKMFRHIAKGIAGIAAAKYGFDKTLKPGIEAAANLQESLLSVKQILQGSHPEAKLLADQMARVKNNSIEVSNVMKYSAREITEVTRQLLKSGVPLEAILDKVNKRGKVTRRGAAYFVEALAETQGTTPGETAAQIGNIGHAFRLKPSQYGAAINLVAQAGPTASGSLTELFHNLGNAGAISKYVGHTSLRTLLAAIKTLSPLGEEGGTDLATFLETTAGMRVRGKKYLQHAGLAGVFYDKNGQYIGLNKSIDKLQKIMVKMTPEQVNKTFGPIFGQQGLKALALLTAPSAPGVKSFREVYRSIGQQADLTQQRKVWEQGLNAQASILSSTNKNTLAALFNPALKPITSVAHWAGVKSANLGAYANAHPGLSKGVTFGAAGLVGGAGLYGLYHLIRAAGPGSRVLRGLFGKLGRTAGGIAEGKAIQATTGVQPVFVVNMPGGGRFGGGAMPGDRGSALDAVIAARRVRTARSFKTLLTSSASLAGGFKSAAGKLGMIGAAAAAGYGIGTEIYQHAVKGSKAEKGIWAFWDWESRLLGIGRGTTLAAAQKRADQIAREALRRQAGRRGAKVDVHLHVDQNGQVKVHKLQTSHPDVNAHVGTALSTP